MMMIPGSIYNLQLMNCQIKVPEISLQELYVPTVELYQC